MEKPMRSAASIISFLPKRTGFSGDGNAHAQGLQQRRSFIASIVPVEVRRKGKGGAGGEFEEPTSPKVTCMGQVKLRKMRCNSNEETKSLPPPAKPDADKRLKSKRTGDASLFLSRMFRRRRRKFPTESEEEKEIGRGDINPASASAPALGTMRWYSSGRETLQDFDWRKVAEQSGREEEDDGAMVAHSGPIKVGSDGAVAMNPKKRPPPPPPPIPLQL
ncbi:uncharacterized protein At1g76070-like isoform X1 [Zingiber officinale]|uniref:uncharacterized protein At1g76070-like isoform X1 n=1 Tax=Zingiber officinale TaxID=94328 RepID=UPI001C4B1F8B|nr:uncharacterized protein At1g76070-like isoform X1 [Zingiber officinale]